MAAQHPYFECPRDCFVDNRKHCLCGAAPDHPDHVGVATTYDNTGATFHLCDTELACLKRVFQMHFRQNPGDREAIQLAEKMGDQVVITMGQTVSMPEPTSVHRRMRHGNKS